MEERAKLLEDKLETPFLMAVFFVVLAGLEWWRDYKNMPPQPVLFTVVALGLCIFAAYRIWRIIPQSKNLRLAAEGERAVAEYLDRLREKGFRIFHDVVGVGFNIDHVLIGPAGVFTIETKTRSKPIGRDARVTFDGETILVDGNASDRDPVVQAKAQARWLRSLLQESTGKLFPIHPVVLFPGWYVESKPGSLSEIWVLEPKALPGFLDHAPGRLESDDVALASFHLSRFIRAGEDRA